MNVDTPLAHRLLLTSDLMLYLQCYADEATRAEPSRAMLEANASRILKRAAELYARTLPSAEAVP